MKLLSALLWSSLLATMAPSAWAQANTIPSQPHLLVKGQGTRTVMPDRFSVDLLVKSTDAQVESARARVQNNVQAVLAAFKGNHAVSGSVRADNLAIRPEHRYAGGKQEYVGTQVSRQVKGSFASTADLQGFLRAVNASDELQISGMRPGYADERALRAQLKGEAAAQTRESARNLASAYGTRITGLYSISDVAPNFAYGVQAGSWPDGDASVVAPAPPSPQAPVEGVPAPRSTESVEAGPITYTENVYAIFLISDGT